MSQSQLNGLYVFGGVTIAMMINSEYIRRTEKVNTNTDDDNTSYHSVVDNLSEPDYAQESISDLTDYTQESEPRRRHSIGGKKTKNKKQKTRKK
jgi:hypothetical protein